MQRFQHVFNMLPRSKRVHDVFSLKNMNVPDIVGEGLDLAHRRNIMVVMPLSDDITNTTEHIGGSYCLRTLVRRSRR